jgi:GTP diphosphokinase / guanosine-3',5'-bis(diphosphate) 3'-diphosphatase
VPARRCAVDPPLTRNRPPGGRINDLLLVLHAADFAAHKHRQQRRKGAAALPYINHPIAVARLLAEIGGVTDAAVLAAGLLHDTIEDTETTVQELERAFGAEVAGLVLEMSDDRSQSKSERRAAQIARAPLLSERARLITLADKTCNVHDIAHDPPPNWSLERRRDYFEWTRRVVDAIRGTHAALERRYDAEYALATAKLSEWMAMPGVSRGE